MTAAPINETRTWDWLMQLARFTESARPWTRRAFSSEHAQGRLWLEAQMRALGLQVAVDAHGNLIGRREGTDPRAGTIMIGSHSDTVAGGGRFDGIAGVIAGLEVAAALGDAHCKLRSALEVVDFLAEEPNDFGVSCVGSRGLAHALDAEMLARNDAAGVSLREALRAVGAVTNGAAARREDVRAFFELHIEQGPVLEAAGCDIGIVTHIVGIRRLAMVYRGQAAHAGTTPIALRRDALAAAAHFITDLRNCMKEAARRGPFVIATVGELRVAPNAANVVAGEVRLTVDLRSEEAALLEEWTQRVRELAERRAREVGVELQECRVASASVPTSCTEALLDTLRGAADALGFSRRDLVSGAGHDAAFLARIAPVAMLFVPSRAGLSHCAEEWTEPAALAKGIATLFQAVRSVDAWPESGAGCRQTGGL